MTIEEKLEKILEIEQRLEFLFYYFDLNQPYQDWLEEINELSTELLYKELEKQKKAEQESQ